MLFVSNGNPTTFTLAETPAGARLDRQRCGGPLLGGGTLLEAGARRAGDDADRRRQAQVAQHCQRTLARRVHRCRALTARQQQQHHLRSPTTAH